MSRDLPYFKFFTGEWLNGDITLEDFELQGLFINVCAYYWHKEGEGIDIVVLEKKFRTDKLIKLYKNGLLKEDEDQFIKIDFLDEQLSEFKTRKKKLSDAGKKGQKIKREKAEIKPPLNHPLTTRVIEDKEKIKNKIKTIEERKRDFATLIFDHTREYGGKTVNEFYLYWSEHGENDKKMRFEKQTSFSITRRLGTWKQNEKKFNNGDKGHSKNNRATTTTSERQNFD